MDAHEGLGTWIGAIATTGAIFFSSLFAILAPRHLHSVSERNLVQRAINNLIVATGLTGAAWEGLLHALKHGEFDDSTPALLNVQISSARTVAQQVPESLLMGGAFLILHGCLMKLVTLEKVIAALGPKETRKQVAERIAFPDALKELKELSQEGAALKPKKVAGFWMIHSPKDDELAK